MYYKKRKNYGAVLTTKSNHLPYLGLICNPVLDDKLKPNGVHTLSKPINQRFVSLASFPSICIGFQCIPERIHYDEKLDRNCQSWQSILQYVLFKIDYGFIWLCNQCFMPVYINSYNLACGSNIRRKQFQAGVPFTAYMWY